MRHLLLILLLAYSANTLASVKFSPEELKNIAVQFLNAKQRLQQPNPSDTDINQFMGLLASDLKTEYIFPEMEPVKADKEEFKKRILHDIQNEFEYSEIDVLAYITGYNFVIVKFIEKSKHKGKVNYQSSDGRKKTLVYDDCIEGELTIVVTLQVDKNGLIDFMSRRIG